MNLVWKEAFRIHFYDAEPGGRAGVPALCRYMEEASNSQTQRLGLSLGQVRESNRMWVLSRLSLKVLGLPAVGDEVTVETWATDRTKGIRAYRDFRMRDSAAKILAEASSLWLLLDATTRRPLRLPESVLRMCHPESVASEAVDSSILVLPEQTPPGERFKVHWGDLDENGHANNIRYLEWALDSVRGSLRQVARLKSLEIQFMDEVLLNEELVSACMETGDPASPSFRHSLRAADDRILALARTDWAKMPAANISVRNKPWTSSPA
jgi:medium-chain acyl-[acyl-carrier-protein] hydrolase